MRVLGHEINNSLAPIRSISASLRETAHVASRHEGWEQDMESGLAVIERRAESLSRFMTSYAKLARLPPPRLGPVEVEEWIRRVAALEKRIPVRVAPGPEVNIEADADQLDQLLINLVRNAADASLARANHFPARSRAPFSIAKIVSHAAASATPSPSPFGSTAA